MPKLKHGGYLIASAFFLILFIATWYLVVSGNEPLRFADEAILSSFANTPKPFLTGITYATNLSPRTLFAAAVFFFLFASGKKLPSFVLLVSYAISFLAIGTVKEAVGRPRPPDSGEGDFAFPSGHVGQGIVIYGTYLYLLLRSRAGKEAKIIYASGISVLLLLVAVSRMALLEHWFSDVAASTFIGLAILFAAIHVMGREGDDSSIAPVGLVLIFVLIISMVLGFLNPLPS